MLQYILEGSDGIFLYWISVELPEDDQ